MSIAYDRRGGLLHIAASDTQWAHLEESLRGIDGGAEKALRAAINDTARFLGGPNGLINRKMREHLNLRAADVKQRVRIRQLAGVADPHAVVRLDYQAVPLEDFKAKFARAMGVAVTTVKEQGVQAFKHMFRAKMASGHVGIFQREVDKPKVLPQSGRYAGRITLRKQRVEGSRYSNRRTARRAVREGRAILRQPIKETFGPSVLKSFDLAPGLAEEVMYQGELYFAKRLDSKIDWILAGKRGLPPSQQLNEAGGGS